MIAVPMTMKLFIGFLAFDLFLNLYTVVIVLVILSSLLVSEHIIMISIPMKRELFIGFVYSFSSLSPPLPSPGGDGVWGGQKLKDAKLRLFLIHW